MTAPSVADYRWLVSDEAAKYLSEAAAEIDPLALVTRLRKTISAERAALVAEQVRLRRRAVEKFSRADAMFFTARGLEQATDEHVARYKARRFFDSKSVVDLCCGIGGDLIALARYAPTVGYDRDEPTAIFAAANCRVDPSHSGVIGTVLPTEASATHVAAADAWHIDPDRRPQGKRTTQVELHEPGAAMLDEWLGVNPHAAIKLAPATTPPGAWQSRADFEWISRGGECKQLVAWFGKFARDPSLRRATVLSPALPPRTVVGTADDELSVAERSIPAKEIGRFVYEPDAAVLAAHLGETLAAQLDLRPLHAGCAYLTGDAAHDDATLAVFEVIDVIPFDARKLRGLLSERKIGRLEIKKRGVDVDPEKLRKELKLNGDESACLILARRGDRVTALLTRRVILP